MTPVMIAFTVIRLEYDLLLREAEHLTAYARERP